METLTERGLAESDRAAQRRRRVLHAPEIADTFSVVGSSDAAWTQKVCAMAMARDGSQPIAYGPWPELGLDDDPWM